MENNLKKFLVLTTGFYVVGAAVLYLGISILQDNLFFLLLSLGIIIVSYGVPFFGLAETSQEKWHFTDQQKKFALTFQIIFLIILALFAHEFIFNIVKAYLYFLQVFISSLFEMDLNPYID
jgi:hypothetical protein